MVGLATIKISLLIFYLRLFPNNWFITATKITIVFVAIYGIVFLFIGLFACHPADVFKIVGPAYCTSIQNQTTYYLGGLSIFQDLIILVLPLPLLLKLQLSTKKKIGIVVIFSVGCL